MKTENLHLSSDESGASLIEYSIVVGSILLVCITGMIFLGQTLRDDYFETFPKMFG